MDKFFQQFVYLYNPFNTKSYENLPTSMDSDNCCLTANLYLLRKKTDEESKTLISQFDSDKLVVSTATSVMATGLNGVFDELITDSTDQVLFFRSFLDPIRYFEDFTGYFFAHDFWGYNIAHPINPDLVGQNQWNLTDAQGDFFIWTMTETAKENGKGFVEYYWPNPITNIDEKKITYVHALPDFHYFIGSGFNIRPDNQKITIEQSNLDIVKGLTLEKPLSHFSASKSLFCTIILQLCNMEKKRTLIFYRTVLLIF